MGFLRRFFGPPASEIAKAYWDKVEAQISRVGDTMVLRYKGETVAGEILRFGKRTVCLRVGQTETWFEISGPHDTGPYGAPLINPKIIEVIPKTKEAPPGALRYVGGGATTHIIQSRAKE